MEDMIKLSENNIESSLLERGEREEWDRDQRSIEDMRCQKDCKKEDQILLSVLDVKMRWKREGRLSLIGMHKMKYLFILENDL